jgi:thymidylate synthase
MVTSGYQKKEAQEMIRETWEMWADEYQEYYEDETPVYPDDMEEFKKEEQKVIDEVIRAIQGLSA